MWVFYLASVLPLIPATYLLYKHKEIVWYEWLGSFGIGLLLAAAFHLLAVTGMTYDTETWSGRVESTTYYPKWVERYTETITETVRDSKGNTKTKTRKETRYRTHGPDWVAYTDLGYNIDISSDTFEDIKNKFGGKVEVKQPWKSGFHSGDKNTYSVNNNTGYLMPVNIHKSFENRVKAAPSLFSFAPIPKDAKVYPYPKNDNIFRSDRLVGNASNYISALEMDRLNARLGGDKKVNIILVGFDKGTDPMNAVFQQSAWIGGKKNDIVICYGGGDGNNPPQWVRTFGWTEEELCKQNLNTLLLKHPINNDVLDIIETEVRKNYRIKDWSKFDYITVEPPTWSYIVYFIMLPMVQIGFWVFAYQNEYQKSFIHQWR